MTRERQNQALLESMNRRVRLQLRLQSTVEGLSVAAVTYYVVGPGRPRRRRAGGGRRAAGPGDRDGDGDPGGCGRHGAGPAPAAAARCARPTGRDRLARPDPRRHGARGRGARCLSPANRPRAAGARPCCPTSRLVPMLLLGVRLALAGAWSGLGRPRCSPVWRDTWLHLRQRWPELESARLCAGLRPELSHVVYTLNVCRCLTAHAATSPFDAPRSAAHAVVIGSGFGGLAAAIRLGARGYRVTVLEQLDAARRPRLGVPPGRLHLRRRADHHHRAVPARGAVGAVRPAPGRRHRPAAGDAVLPHPLRRRRRVRLHRRRRRDARRGRAVLARRRRRLRALHARQRGDLPRRLRAARRRAVRRTGPTWRASRPTWCGCGGYRSVYAHGRALRAATSGCARCSASIRCWSAAIRSPPAPSTA